MWLEELAPHAAIDQYWHNRTGRGRLSRMDRKADAHMKRQIMGREVVVIWALIVHGRDIAELWRERGKRRKDSEERDRV